MPRCNSFYKTMTNLLQNFVPYALSGGFVLLCGGLYAADLPREAPEYTYRVINTFPHDPAAFTQGLVYHEGHFFEGTGLWGESSLRKVDLETGTVLQKIDLDARYFGEGITIFDNRIIQQTWQSHIGFVYEVETFDRLTTFAYPTEGWGLTHDGQRLIFSDGTSTIRFLDPSSFAVTSTIQVRDGTQPINKLNELEFVKGEILANVWLTDWIVKIDPPSGQVTGWIDCAGLLPKELRSGNRDDVLNGIAYDRENDRLFVTGKRWPLLFEIEIVPKSASIKRWKAF